MYFFVYFQIFISMQVHIFVLGSFMPALVGYCVQDIFQTEVHSLFKSYVKCLRKNLCTYKNK